MNKGGRTGVSCTIHVWPARFGGHPALFLGVRGEDVHRGPDGFRGPCGSRSGSGGRSRGCPGGAHALAPCPLVLRRGVRERGVGEPEDLLEGQELRGAVGAEGNR